MLKIKRNYESNVILITVFQIRIVKTVIEWFSCTPILCCRSEYYIVILRGFITKVSTD